MRPITEGEWAEFVRRGEFPFHATAGETEFELFRIGFPLQRSLAVFDAGEIVATAGAFDFATTVPGGNPVRTAGVTAVAVMPTHRRRGLLTAIMHRQLRDYREDGIPLATLWASESGIYRRFGYGLASWALLLEVERGAALRPGVALSQGRFRLASSGDADTRAEILAIDRATHPLRPGRHARDEAWLGRSLADPEAWRRGLGPLNVVLHEDDAGTADGWAAYAVKQSSEHGLSTGEVRVRFLDATTPAARAALWRWLFDLDLMRRVHTGWLATDDPLLTMLADPRRARPAMRDNLYCRLVDVAAALSARSYSRPVDAVLEVTDPIAPWNAGRWRLSGDERGARCERSSDPADVALGVAELGAAFLGGPSLRSMGAAGLVAELRPGALAAVSAAFHGDIAPLSDEVF